MTQTSKIEVYLSQEREEVLEFWTPMLQSKIPELYGINNLCESVGLVLIGQAGLLIGKKDGQKVGCMIFQPMTSRLDGTRTAMVRQLYGPNQGLAFRDALLARLKSMGFNKMAGSTFSKKHEAFQRLIGMKFVSAYYEREV